MAGRWSKEVYIRQMYDVIYDNMVEAGVARTLETPAFMDNEGNIVDEHDNNRLGLACTIEITHPDYILFADETGCNTSQKKWTLTRYNAQKSGIKFRQILHCSWVYFC